ncbi:hypothetical protein FB451DRAFT_1188692 [Mycena latifolia]|nr:hypothetical protein FB451DRAFT_1188692 [Mycena latifolia]
MAGSTYSFEEHNHTFAMPPAHLPLGALTLKSKPEFVLSQAGAQYALSLQAHFAEAFAEAQVAQSMVEAQFAQTMAELHWELRKGTKISTPEDGTGPSRDATSPGSSYRALSDPAKPYGGKPHPRAASWMTAVTVAAETCPAHEPVLMGQNTARTSYTQLYRDEPYRPCAECQFFECPNAGGAYGCPYATVYEVPDRYDESARRSGGTPDASGYETLAPSANPRDWTFENTGCRLYALGLNSLLPASTEGCATSEKVAA